MTCDNKKLRVTFSIDIPMDLLGHPGPDEIEEIDCDVVDWGFIAWLETSLGISIERADAEALMQDVTTEDWSPPEGWGEFYSDNKYGTAGAPPKHLVLGDLCETCGVKETSAVVNGKPCCLACLLDPVEKLCDHGVPLTEDCRSFPCSQSSAKATILCVHGVALTLPCMDCSPGGVQTTIVSTSSQDEGPTTPLEAIGGVKILRNKDSV